MQNDQKNDFKFIDVYEESKNSYLKIEKYIKGNLKKNDCLIDLMKIFENNEDFKKVSINKEKSKKKYILNRNLIFKLQSSQMSFNDQQKNKEKTFFIDEKKKFEFKLNLNQKSVEKNKKNEVDNNIEQSEKIEDFINTISKKEIQSQEKENNLEKNCDYFNNLNTIDILGTKNDFKISQEFEIETSMNNSFLIKKQKSFTQKYNIKDIEKEKKNFDKSTFSKKINNFKIKGYIQKLDQYQDDFDKKEINLNEKKSFLNKNDFIKKKKKSKCLILKKNNFSTSNKNVLNNIKQKFSKSMDINKLNFKIKRNCIKKKISLDMRIKKELKKSDLIKTLNKNFLFEKLKGKIEQYRNSNTDDDSNKNIPQFFLVKNKKVSKNNQEPFCFKKKKKILKKTKILFLKTQLISTNFFIKNKIF